MAVNLTNNYKELALKWLVGLYETDPGENTIKFNEFDNVENDLQQELETSFPNGFTYKGIVQGNNSNDEGLEYSVVYGIYKNDNNEDRGALIILDENYNIVQIITKYSNDDDIGTIISLNVGNDGRFFMVEYDLNGYYRFVLLNNILAKSPTEENYQLVMRQTYRFPDQTKVSTTKMIVIKHPQEARYLTSQIIHDYVENEEDLYCIEFVINVGSENEWNTYNCHFASWTFDPAEQTIEVDDLLVSWDEENKMLFKVSSAEVRPNIMVSYSSFTKLLNSDTIVRKTSIISWGATYDYAKSIIKNINVSYVTTSKVVDNNYVYEIYEVVKNDNQDFDDVSLIKSIDNVSSATFYGVRLMKHQDDIFFIYQNTNTYVGIIVDDNVYTSEFTSFSSSVSDTLFFLNVQKMFNLYIVYSQNGNYVNFAKLIYIDKNKNSSSINFASMNPYFGVLYDDNNKMIFARTLYNKSITGQTTTSTIQVPNQFINNMSINVQELYGKSYIELINNADTFTKNEYEEVYVNFANTWNVINNNDINNPVLNNAAAARFNLAISQATPDPYFPDNPDYEGIYEYANSWTQYYRINYSDNTFMEKYFSEEDVTIVQQNPLKYRYHINFIAPPDKDIINIQILSTDKQTIYQTINNLSLEAGKYYEITQDVYVV